MFSERATVAPEQKFRVYYKKTDSKKYTVLCLTAIGIFLLGIGIALIVVGKDNDIEDLLILGPIFLVAGIAFSIFMIYILSKDYYEKKNVKRGLQEKQKRLNDEKNGVKSNNNMNNESSGIKNVESKPYITNYQQKMDETNDVQKRKGPSQSQLYGKAIAIGHFITTPTPPKAVEVKSVIDVTSVKTEPQLKKEIPKSILQDASLYGNTDELRLSSSRSPPPKPTLSTGSMADVPASLDDYTCSTGSPVPSVMDYSLGDDITENSHFNMNT